MREDSLNEEEDNDEVEKRHEGDEDTGEGGLLSDNDNEEYDPTFDPRRGNRGPRVGDYGEFERKFIKREPMKGSSSRRGDSRGVC